MQISFTTEALRDLPIPARLPSGAVNQVRYWDDTMPGFGVRVSSNGRRRWVFQTRINGRTKIFTLSRDLDLAGARAEAYQLREAVAGRGAHQTPSLGAEPTSPAGTPPAAVLTFGAALEKFLVFVEKERRPKTYATYLSLAKNLAPLADLPAASVTRRDVASALRSLRDARHNVIANRSATLAGVVLTWLARRGEIDSAPDLRGLATREVPRSRRLNADSRMAKPSELPLLIAAADRLAPVYRAFTWLSILTGQRLREISELGWTEIILDSGNMGPRIILPAERCKNGNAHVVPLGGFAQAILRELPRISEWTFTASRGGPLHSAAMPRRMLEQEITRLRAQFPERFGDQLTEPWTWHDLRRTAATGWRQLGASYELIDSMLNHRSGIAHAGTRAAYVHGDDWQERRALAEKWERYLLETAAAVEPLQQAA